MKRSKPNEAKETKIRTIWDREWSQSVTEGNAAMPGPDVRRVQVKLTNVCLQFLIVHQLWIHQPTKNSLFSKAVARRVGEGMLARSST